MILMLVKMVTKTSFKTITIGEMELTSKYNKDI